MKSCLIMMMMPDVLFSMSLLQVHDNKCPLDTSACAYIPIRCHLSPCSGWPGAYYGGCTSYAHCEHCYTHYTLLLLIKNTLTPQHRLVVILYTSLQYDFFAYYRFKITNKQSIG